jgi:hypothetical protein
MKMLALMTTILATACHTAPRADAGPASPATTPTAQTTPATTSKVSAAAHSVAAAELTTRRAQMIGFLHDYTEAGQYPTDDAGLPQSVFVDARGIRCPMAELIFRSGHPELVQAVALEHNKVRLADVNEGPLLAWMQSSGLTRDEINLIQGAADIDYMWMQEMQMESEATILARGQIRGRLETAERSLRDGTPHSLEVAVAALPNGTVPEVKLVAGTKVIPAVALKSGPSGRPLTAAVRVAQPRFRRIRQFDAQSIQIAPNGSVTLAPSAVRN